MRRARGHENFEREAAVIEHARANGFPAPCVFDVMADAIVLERIPGRTMLADLIRRPWRARAHAKKLALLHLQLHRIEAPESLPEAGPGKTLLHIDFHPGNVLLSPTGPVVVDWINAHKGPPSLDVALTWVIAATSGGVVGRMMIPDYLRAFDRATIRAALPFAAERRLADRNVTERERERVRRLVRKEG